MSVSSDSDDKVVSSPSRSSNNGNSPTSQDNETATTLIKHANEVLDKAALPFLNARDKRGVTAMELAKKNNFPDVFDLLKHVEGCKIPSAASKQLDNTDLHEFSMKGEKSLIDIMLKIESIDVNRVDSKGFTALHYG